jgi:KDO2-lipid IV(A) lauroyltransferase
MITYAGYKLVQFFSALTPPALAYPLCALAGSVWFRCAPRRRTAVINNEMRILAHGPGGVPSAGLARHAAREVFVNFCRYLYEFFRFQGLSERWVSENVDIIGLEYLRDALRARGGAIALTIHLGNWELGARVTALSGFPVSAVALEDRGRRAAKLFFREREKCGIRVFGVGNAVKEVLRALARNEVVALLADFDPTDKGVAVNFFGKPVVFSRGPFAIAAKAHAPIVPCAMVRSGAKKFQLIFDAPVLMEEGKRTEEEIIERMERFISAYPSQWCIFRDVWNTSERPGTGA